jgi:hypothetical protein
VRRRSLLLCATSRCEHVPPVWASGQIGCGRRHRTGRDAARCSLSSTIACFACPALLYASTGWTTGMPSSPHHHSRLSTQACLQACTTSHLFVRVACPPTRRRACFAVSCSDVMYSRPALSLSHCTHPPTHTVPSHTHARAHTRYNSQVTSLQ